MTTSIVSFPPGGSLGVDGHTILYDADDATDHFCPEFNPITKEEAIAFGPWGA